jgi:hypothetical protein
LRVYHTSTHGRHLPRRKRGQMRMLGSMDTRTIVSIQDDLADGPANTTVSFGLGGRDYEIDLTNANAEKFREMLDTYIAAGRKAGGTRRRRRGFSPVADVDPRGVRAWAAAKGYGVSNRGRIPGQWSGRTELLGIEPFRRMCLGTMLGAVRSARHRHGLPAREASEAGFTGSDLSVVLLAYVDAVLTTSAAGGRGIATEVAAGVDLAARFGVGLLDPCLRPVRDREDLGCHTAKASTPRAVSHVLRLRAISGAGQVASVAGTAGVLLFAATAAHPGVPDSWLIAPSAPDGLRGHGAVCGRGRPGVQHGYRLMTTGCRYPPLVATGNGGGATVVDPEGFRSRRETRRIVV